MKRPGTRSLVWLAGILAVASIGFAAIPLPRRFAGDSGLPPPGPVAQPGDAAAPVSIDPILDLSPFGRLIRAATGGSEAQETSLGLILHGVVIADRPEASSAIVSGPSSPARVYRIDDEIAPSASLDAVFGDHVVLQVDGRSEILSFPKGAAIETPETPGDVASDSGVEALRALVTGDGEAPDDIALSAPAPSDDADAPEDVGNDISAADGNDISAAIERYRSEIRDDPQMVLDNLGLVPLGEGYSVDTDASQTLLNAGLLPGDVVSKVNGQQVGDIEEDRQYFDDVIESGRARIEIVRDGQRIVLSFPLR